MISWTENLHGFSVSGLGGCYSSIPITKQCRYQLWRKKEWVRNDWWDGVGVLRITIRTPPPLILCVRALLTPGYSSTPTHTHRKNTQSSESQLLLAVFVVAGMLGSYHLQTQTGRTCGREGESHSRSDIRQDCRHRDFKESRETSTLAKASDTFWSNQSAQHSSPTKRMTTGGEIRQLMIDNQKYFSTFLVSVNVFRAALDWACWMPLNPTKISK